MAGAWSDSAQLLDVGSGVISTSEPVEPACHEACPPHLRRMSLVVGKDGDAGMKLGAGAGVGEAHSKLEDLVPDKIARDNIVSATARSLRSFLPSLAKHDGHMVIVGSGP